MKTYTTDNNLLTKVKDTIIENNLIQKGETVIVALSGGADSVCLLHILNNLKDEMGFCLKAAHLNHGIRGDEALRDENFAKDICEKLGIEIFVRKRNIPEISKGKNTELVGREERYRFFSELSEKLGRAKIAVAHNKNDVAETVVMRLIRGSSVFGLKGIPVKNENIIRPLLFVSRKEIEEFLSLKGIEFVDDSSNFGDDYTRNKIRHNILPAMESISEGYLSSVTKTAERLGKVSDFIVKSALEAYGPIGKFIDIERIEGLHEVLREYIISESAYQAGMSEISKANISEIEKLFSCSSGKRVCITEGYEAVRIYSEIKFEKKNKCTDYYKELKIGKNYIEEADFTIEIKRSEKGIDLEKVKLPLIARPRRSGDFIESEGMSGSKKIKKLFVDEKLPIDKRGIYPLILSEDKIVFALGRCGKQFISDESTKKAVTITIREGEC